MKKGVAIGFFIIISIIILISIAYVLYLKSEFVKYTLEGKGEEYKKLEGVSNSLKNNIDSCLKESLKLSILRAGMQGGYYDLPENSDYFFSLSYGLPYNFTTFDWETHYSPYYFNKGKSYMPSIITLQNELSKYVKEFSSVCINISDFNSSIIIQTNDPTVLTTFFDKKTNVKFSYPITLKYQGTQIDLKDFNSELPFSFIEKYNLVKGIIEEQKKSPNTVPLGYITKMVHDNKLYFESYDNDEKQFIEIKLYFNESLFEDKNYIYTFLLGYNWREK